MTSVTLLDAFKDEERRGLAWARFDAKYRPLIHRYYSARRSNRPRLQPSDVDDLTNIALLSLVEMLPKFEYDPNRKFRSYTRGLLNNVENKFLRDRYKRNPVGKPPNDGIDLQGDSPEADAIAEALESDSIVARIAEQVLSTKGFEGVCGEAVRLCIFQGRTINDVAKSLAISYMNIYRLIQRFQARVRESIEADYPDLIDK